MGRAIRPIVLLTDFGLRDPYVGILKGVILSVHPTAQIVDLTHDVGSQDLASAYVLLRDSYRYFPRGTIFVSVVDPGVGTDRSIIGIQTRDFVFLAPDNGILGFLQHDRQVRRIVRIENAKYFRPTVSSTFHGRDIFAPVAGHLSRGLNLGQLGSAIRSIRSLKLPKATSTPAGVSGEVVAVDRFGNLVTNIPADRLSSPGTVCIRVGRREILGVAGTYADRKAGKTLAYVGSTGFLEIAVNRGDAARKLNVRVGQAVRVRP